MTDVTIDKYDREGVFVVMAEGRSQGPIVMETEGANSSYEAAEERLAAITWPHRYCICRVIPISGNELLSLDMQRMQK